MRKFAILTVLLAASLGVALSAFAQRPGLEVPELTPGPGWKTCPRCENDAHIADERAKANVDTRPFDKHDLSGVWGNEGIRDPKAAHPPFTPEGQKLYDALAKQVEETGDAKVAAKDPLLICDPLGTVRSLAYNYGMEFIPLPDRVLQMFKWSHSWRTVWTDGRKLPASPPILRFLGYNVGRWDGDTFLVESSGYDERALLGTSSIAPVYPHSSDMKIEETYKRLDYGKLQATYTVTDPNVYTKPWTTSDTILLLPNAEIGEYLCVPSDSIDFNTRQTDAAGVAPTKER